MGRNNKDLSEYEKGQIDAFKSLNLRHMEISRKIQRHKSTLTKYLQRKYVKSKKSNFGKKSKLENLDERRIFNLATKRRMSCRKIKTTMSLPVSGCTI